MRVMTCRARRRKMRRLQEKQYVQEVSCRIYIITRSLAVARKAERTVYDVRTVRYSCRTLSGITMGSLVTLAIPHMQTSAVRLSTVCFNAFARWHQSVWLKKWWFWGDKVGVESCKIVFLGSTSYLSRHFCCIGLNDVALLNKSSQSYEASLAIWNHSVTSTYMYLPPDTSELTTPRHNVRRHRQTDGQTEKRTDDSITRSVRSAQNRDVAKRSLIGRQQRPCTSKALMSDMTRHHMWP